MRKAMICVSVMLALFQLWPIVFGQRVPATTARAAAADITPKQIEAVALVDKLPRLTPATVSIPAPKSCYRQYRVKFDQCPANDQACHAKAADHWDLCEATGMWPQ